MTGCIIRRRLLKQFRVGEQHLQLVQDIMSGQRREDIQFPVCLPQCRPVAMHISDVHERYHNMYRFSTVVGYHRGRDQQINRTPVCHPSTLFPEPAPGPGELTESGLELFPVLTEINDGAPRQCSLIVISEHLRERRICIAHGAIHRKQGNAILCRLDSRILQMKVAFRLTNVGDILAGTQGACDHPLHVAYHGIMPENSPEFTSLREHQILGNLFVGPDII
ncbi:hypothetical protein MKMG_01632 [Methanogenium sp. MK-MG]|nr:hypothetical protein MKMG_01632 [Methanogenium sp. MK-MG]